MLNRKVLVVLGFLLLAPVAANACPYCAFSPSGWGFCRYGANVGYYDCSEYVQDPFSGRTACSVCGYCNGYHPYLNQACDAGDGDCGQDPTNPCDQSLKQPGSGSCSPDSRIAESTGLRWVGLPADQVAIF